MSGNLIAGFAPVNTASKGGSGSNAGAGDAASPLGVFGALLDAEPAPVEYAASAPVANKATETGVIEAREPLDVEFNVETPVEPEPDGKAYGLGSVMEIRRGGTQEEI